jgi:hypothetical protein
MPGNSKNDNRRDISKILDSSSSAISVPTVATSAIFTMKAQYPKMSMMMPLSQSNTPGASLFNSKNVSEFLKTWENLCEDYLVNDVNRLRKLPRYCSRLIRLYVETIPEYERKDWEGLKTVLL